MHESSLAKQILDLSLRHADTPGARVRAVRGRVAETETLSGDSLALHFQAHARGTRAEGAHLDFEFVHVHARCLGCAAVYAPEHHVLVCPTCGSTAGEELEATGLHIESVDVDDGG